MKKSAAKKSKSLLLSDIIYLAHIMRQAGKSIFRKNTEFGVADFINCNKASALDLIVPAIIVYARVQNKTEKQARRNMQAILSLAKGTA